MNAPTNIQIINDANGAPAFVVIPYASYIQSGAEPVVPHAVVSMMVDNGWNALQAWRKHLGLTQSEVAAKLGISQGGYAQMETGKRRPESSEKIAKVLGIEPALLDL